MLMPSDQNLKKIINQSKILANNVVTTAYYLQRIAYVMAHKGSIKPKPPRQEDRFSSYSSTERHGGANQVKHIREGSISKIKGIGRLTFEELEFSVPFNNTLTFYIPKIVDMFGSLQAMYTRESVVLPRIGSSQVYGERSCSHVFDINKSGSLSQDKFYGSNDPERIPQDLLVHLRQQVNTVGIDSFKYAKTRQKNLRTELSLLTTLANLFLWEKINSAAFPNASPHIFRSNSNLEHLLHGVSSYILFNDVTLDPSNSSMTIDIEEFRLDASLFLKEEMNIVVCAIVYGSITIHNDLTITHQLKYKGPFDGIITNSERDLAKYLPEKIDLKAKLNWSNISDSIESNFFNKFTETFSNAVLPVLNIARIMLIKNRQFEYAEESIRVPLPNLSGDLYGYVQRLTRLEGNSSYELAYLLTALDDLADQSIIKLNKLHQHTKLELKEEQAIRKAIIQSMTAVAVELLGVEELETKNKKIAHFAYAKFLAKAALDQLIELEADTRRSSTIRHPTGRRQITIVTGHAPTPSTPAIIVCASNLLAIAILEFQIFPERIKQLLDLVDFAINALTSSISKIVDAIKDRVTAPLWIIEKPVPIRIGSSFAFKFKIEMEFYYLVDKKKIAVNTVIVEKSEVNEKKREMMREVDKKMLEHVNQLKAEAKSTLDIFKKTLAAWETLRHQLSDQPRAASALNISNNSVSLWGRDYPAVLEEFLDRREQYQRNRT